MNAGCGRDYQVTVADDLARWQAGLAGRPDVTMLPMIEIMPGTVRIVVGKMPNGRASWHTSRQVPRHPGQSSPPRATTGFVCRAEPRPRLVLLPDPDRPDRPDRPGKTELKIARLGRRPWHGRSGVGHGLRLWL